MNVDHMEDMSWCAAPDSRPLWRRILGRMFPVRLCPLPDVPEECKDCLHGVCVTRFGWADRLRILVGGVVVTEFRCVTQNEMGSTFSTAICYPSTLIQQK